MIAKGYDNQKSPETGLEPFHELSGFNQDYYLLLRRMAVLHCVKGHDYGTSHPSGLGNLMECERFGVKPWLGILIRMCDKWIRIQGFINRGVLRVKDESFEDTLMDLAAYSLLCILAWRWDKKIAQAKAKANTDTNQCGIVPLIGSPREAQNYADRGPEYVGVK